VQSAPRFPDRFRNHSDSLKYDNEWLFTHSIFLGNADVIYLCIFTPSQGSEHLLFEYVSKFIIGGCILVLATYFSKSKNLFLSGVITTLPLMTLANMSLQMKFMDSGEFHLAQKSGIFGALGLALFVFCVFLLTNWMKPLYAILLSLLIYALYFTIYKFLN
jgi:uncharacterized membrane protein (GlpM family)